MSTYKVENSTSSTESLRQLWPSSWWERSDRRISHYAILRTN